MGAWLGRGLTDNQKQLSCLIESAGKSEIDIAIIGSEVLLRGDMAPEDLIDSIRYIKSQFQKIGVKEIPVVYADVYSIFLQYPEIVDEIDIIYANFYPFWEGIPVESAIAHLDWLYQKLYDSFSRKKPIHISETGWPTCGEVVHAAVPSPSNAAYYFLNFVSWAEDRGVPYHYFAGFDELWKRNREGQRGACWGVFDRLGNLKNGFDKVFNNEMVSGN